MVATKPSFFASLLSKLPARAKRAILLASLYAESTPNGKSSTELGELNNAMALVNDPEALRLPALFRDLLWREHRTELSDAIAASGQGGTQSLAAVKTVVRSTPWWLEYANSEEMTRDLQRLFNILHLKAK